MKSYPSPELALQDVLRLAAAMTYKFAVAGVARGGAKAVIAAPPDLAPEARSSLLRRYGTLVRQLGGLFDTGPDVGTTAEDMDVIAETGAPHIYGRTTAAGGAGDSGPATALGVFAAITLTCERLFGSASLEGRRILVQGAGSVGGPLIVRLRDAGAAVMFSEVDEVLIRRLCDDPTLKSVPPEVVYETECDIFAPCAFGGILDAETIPRLKCRAVVGAANNQLGEADDADRLRARGILYAPDYVVNMGGVVALSGIEDEGWPQDKAEERIVENVRSRLTQVFDLAETGHITTEEAARRVAEGLLSD